MRKDYRATGEGEAMLEAAKPKLRELVSEVLHDRPPGPSIRSDHPAQDRREPGP
ncbi:MAG: hypothetical protein JO284_17410 [Planctomycetaceae bacterium]|nr:hypothetical protein [Planctomycetaceae bacterium]MBV8609296.1 hypothetical protein [Singulisphaera sp.]MBV8233544.1 hypothetical protein [Planctomycetaceae bacterium]MBV8266779.1 hypothetical protein [Planctomycetaceae bacterium]MBV8315500.1 hypothetical protein [Planctomycetaceae bacterium]